MRTVLIIDDEAWFRKLLGEWLGRNGWEVLEAQDGEEGLRLARERRPNVILCDLLMTPMNGFQVCRALKASEATRHSKIVVTTGRDFDSDRKAALDAGADEYLTKPIDPIRLSILLSQMAAQTTHSAPPVEPDDGDLPLRVKFWGVRGSVPTPGAATLEYGGNTSCVELRVGSQIIILDAGTGLRPLGRSLLEEFGDQPIDLVLLLTHTHWDHIQGLPFFLPVYQPRNRLRILGYEGARNGLESVLTSQMATPFFPVGLHELPANITIDELKNLNFNLGPVQVRATFANHPGMCVGYRLFASGRSIAFFPDNELRHQGRSRADAPGAPEATAEFARRENAKLAEFLRGCDVLIMDTQYDAEEYREHLGWGHGCLDEVVALALQAEVQRLFLFHHDPDHSDSRIDEMVRHARNLIGASGGNLQIEAAREGAVLELTPLKAPMETAV